MNLVDFLKSIGDEYCVYFDILKGEGYCKDDNIISLSTFENPVLEDLFERGIPKPRARCIIKKMREFYLENSKKPRYTPIDVISNDSSNDENEENERDDERDEEDYENVIEDDDIRHITLNAKRESVLSSYKTAENENHVKYLKGNAKATEQYIFSNQKEDAMKIVNTFYNTTVRIAGIRKRTKLVPMD